MSLEEFEIDEEFEETQSPRSQTARNLGIELIDGKWAPARFMKRQQDIISAQAREREESKKAQTITIFVVIIALMMPMVFLMLMGGFAYVSCFIFMAIIIVLVVVIWVVMSAASNMDKVAIQNIQGLYPVVETRGGRIFLDGRPVDINNVASCHLDRGHEEFKIIGKDWKRTVILYKQYEWPDTMVSALKVAFEVNGIPVEETLFNFQDPNAVQEISRGANVQAQTDTTIQQRQRIASAQAILEVERQKKAEEVRLMEVVKPVKATSPEKVKRAESIVVQGLPTPAKPPIARMPPPPVPSKPGSFCRRCGAKVDEDLIECPRCGAGL